MGDETPNPEAGSRAGAARQARLRRAAHRKHGQGQKGLSKWTLPSHVESETPDAEARHSKLVRSAMEREKNRRGRGGGDGDATKTKGNLRKRRGKKSAANDDNDVDEEDEETLAALRPKQSMVRVVCESFFATVRIFTNVSLVIFGIFFFMTNFPLLFDDLVRGAAMPETMPPAHSPVSANDWCPSSVLSEISPQPPVYEQTTSAEFCYKAHGSKRRSVSMFIADAYCSEASLYPLVRTASKTSTAYAFNASLSTSTMPVSHVSFRRRLFTFVSKVLDRYHNEGAHPNQRKYRVVVVAHGFTAGHILKLMAEDNEFRHLISSNGGSVVLISPLIFPFGPTGAGVMRQLQPSLISLRSAVVVSRATASLQKELIQLSPRLSRLSSMMTSYLDNRDVAVWRFGDGEEDYKKLKRPDLQKFYPIDLISPNATLSSLRTGVPCTVLVPRTETYTVNSKVHLQQRTTQMQVHKVQGDHWAAARSDDANKHIAAATTVA